MVSLPGLRGRKTVPQRSAGELDAMAAAGALVAAALRAVHRAAAPGVSTHDLDQVAEAVIRDGGGIPSFKGYHGFPASICSSLLPIRNSPGGISTIVVPNELVDVTVVPNRFAQAS